MYAKYGFEDSILISGMSSKVHLEPTLYETSTMIYVMADIESAFLKVVSRFLSVELCQSELTVHCLRYTTYL